MKSKLANTFGYVSVLCSVSFWVLLVLDRIPGFPMKGIDLSANYWAAIWGVAVLLALVAAAIGSRRWAWAALIPIANIALLIVLVNLQEWWAVG